MQKNDMTDFDLRMRAMLEDAREEVPEGVWSAVEARVADPKRVILTWRRTVAGFAAAAAVAAFCLIPRHRDGGPVGTIIADNRAKIETVESAEVPDMAEQIERSGILLADIPGAERDKPAKWTLTVPSELSAPQELESVADEIVGIEPETAGEPAQQARDERVQAGPAEWNDPFEGLEDEPEAASSGRFSFSVQGNLADNDKSSSTKNVHRAPGNAAVVKTGVTEKSQSTYDVPVSFGIGAKYYFNDRFAVGSGINYSLLGRSFTGVYNEVSDEGVVTKSISTDIYNEIHYIGIPLNLYYNVVQSGNIDFYVYGGGSVEKGLGNNFRIKSEPDWFWYKEKVPGLQWSVTAGLGLEFGLYKMLSLYLDPSVRYYFECGQPNSVRTSRPFMFNFDVGLRISFGK